MKRCLLLLFLLLCVQPIQAQQTNPDVDKDLHKLTLRKAIDLALKNNLDIDVEKYNPEISETNVRLEESKFAPLFSANLNTNDSDQPTGSSLVGLGIVNYKTVDYNFTFQQLLKTGTSYNVAFNNQRIETNQLFTSVNPRYDSSLFLNVTQPLLRNFGLEITKTPLQIAEKNRMTFDSRLQQRMMDVSLQVEHAYWDLYFALHNLDVQKQSLAAAQDLYENNKKQVEVGTMAPLDIVVAEAEVAAREQGIIQAEAAIKNTADRLKLLVFGEKEPEKWSLELFPTDEPVVRPVEITEDEAIQLALAENPDLKALTTDMESKQLSAKLASNALKPQLDLKASVGYLGLGGERLLFNDDFPPGIIGSLPGGYGDSLSSLFDNRTWGVGFVVGIPIGNKAAEASYIKADLSQKQASRSLENTRQQLMLNVRTTIRNLQTDIKRLDAARASRVLQEKKLDAEKKKLAVGLSTNHFVLDFQKDLAQAQSDELQALVDYNKDQAQLARYLGNILQQ